MKKVPKSESRRSPEETRAIFRRVEEIMADEPPVTLDHEPTHEEMQERMCIHSKRRHEMQAERKLHLKTGDESE